MFFSMSEINCKKKSQSNQYYKKVFEPGGIQQISKGVGNCRYVPRIILSLKLQHILLTNHKFGFHECSHMTNLRETYKG